MTIKISENAKHIYIEDDFNQIHIYEVPDWLASQKRIAPEKVETITLCQNASYLKTVDEDGKGGSDG